MKKLFISLLILFTLTGCTLTPMSFDNDASSQNINTSLVCAKQIDLYPLSINEANPPQEAFNHYLKKLKEYTTNNIIVHETMKLSMEEEKVNDFVKNYGDETLHIYDLSKKNRDRFLQFIKQTKATKNSIVMIYTPQLFSNPEEKKRLNGRLFQHSYHPHIMAFNPLNINDSPVISDIQAWKIVFMQILGYTLGVPANSDHNKAGNCTRRECVMYPKPDWRAVMSVLLLNGMPYDFCHKCKAELKEAKERCIKQPLPLIISNTKEKQ
ncbi:MAG: Unknown protein [uncultured Sulfurovum sp.]|uniref:Lipoprotein n=1 Tax=uncultured Sulfurovum sp. TaxID=269237 RepID=A0A6S6TXG5_9BACT|nr:MAG: Unknown protein [uncultured Sulfurovum sp.]